MPNHVIKILKGPGDAIAGSQRTRNYVAVKTTADPAKNGKDTVSFEFDASLIMGVKPTVKYPIYVVGLGPKGAPFSKKFEVVNGPTDKVKVKAEPAEKGHLEEHEYLIYIRSVDDLVDGNTPPRIIIDP